MSVRESVSSNPQSPEAEVVEIRKYSNRRLYDTSASRYIKLTDVEDMIRQGKDVRVMDAQTGEDLTKSVMLQIICESKSQQEVLPIGFLRQVIQASGKTVRHSLQEFLSMGLQAQREFQQQVSQWVKAGASLNPFLGPLSAWFGNSAQNPPAPARHNGPSAAKPEAQAETRSEVKSEAKPDVKSEAKPDVKSEAIRSGTVESGKDGIPGEPHHHGGVQQEIEMLRQQLALLQKQIDRIGKS